VSTGYSTAEIGFGDSESFSGVSESMNSLQETCALCQQITVGSSLREGVDVFCCSGCHVVFNILSAQQALAHYETHPLFQNAVKSGIISNPFLLEQLRAKQKDSGEENIERLCFEVGDMWCPSCAQVIELILMQQAGIKRCLVDYATDLASVEFFPCKLGKEQIYSKIRSLGYQPIEFQEQEQKQIHRTLSLQCVIAAFCSLNLMMFTYPIYSSYFHGDQEGYGGLFTWLSFAMVIPVITYSAHPIFKRLWTGLYTGIYGMETLVAISVSSAMGFSLYELFTGGMHVYFDSIAIIITFVLLGKIIETRAKFSAKKAIRRLSQSLPKRGRKRLLDGTFQFVSIKEIAPGDVIQACTGEKIVLDGTVIAGEGTCDEALMTGEAIPVYKTVQSRVISGSIVQSGVLTVQVTCASERSTLQQMIGMVESSLHRKEGYIRAVDRIVRWFVPVVLLCSLGTFIFCLYVKPHFEGHSVVEIALLRALSILLIACPCAIGIAAPIAESQLIENLSSLGALVRNRAVLAHLGRETIWVFDKTGTLTEGKFTILQGFKTLSAMHKGLLKSLVIHSSHPLSVAIARAVEVEIPPIPLERIEEVAGKGMQAHFQGKLLLLGSRDFLQMHGVLLSPEEKCSLQEIVSQVYFAYGGTLITVLKLGDRIRPGFENITAALAPAETLLLSGDGAFTVEAVARVCGFQQWVAACTPQQKREYIQELRHKGHYVGMAGDGINDVLALTAAHTGISVINASDISIQVSDILLTTEKMQLLPEICVLARKGQRIIQQNLFWAFIYNIVGIGLAMAGLLSPIFASGAMVASSLMVLFNAKRIKK
jgi:heavy metal translocating P-type ATPase